MIDERTMERFWEKVAAATTECVNGHPFDDANTYRLPNGMRVCRECRRLRERERYWATKKAEETPR